MDLGYHPLCFRSQIKELWILDPTFWIQLPGFLTPVTPWVTYPTTQIPSHPGICDDPISWIYKSPSQQCLLDLKYEAYQFSMSSLMRVRDKPQEEGLYDNSV